MKKSELLRRPTGNSVDMPQDVTGGPPSRSACAALLVAVAATWSCNADLGGDSSKGNSDSGQASGSKDETGDGPTGVDTDPKGMGLRLLTSAEYRHTVSDLFGVDLTGLGTFPDESHADTGFAKVSKIDEVDVGAYQGLSQLVVENALPFIEQEMGCLDDSDLDCLSRFVSQFGRRVYRKPITSDEVVEHLDFYSKLLTQGTTVDRARQLLVAAMLESPYFLYHWENAEDVSGSVGDTVRLNPFHLASRLSYFLWASPPDEALLAAAESGALLDDARLKTEVRRMLDDSRSKRGVASFHEQWLELDSLPLRGKSAGLYPEWGPELAGSMLGEFERFVTTIVLSGDGTLATLFSSNQSFVNAQLAELYQISIDGASTDSDGFAAASLPSAERSGILTLAAVLTAHAGEVEGSPILRGKFVRERILCESLRPPPDGIPPLPEPTPDVSIRERHQLHVSDPACAGCHQLTDPIGFGLGNFDAIGAFQAEDGGKPIDASGRVLGLDGSDVNFNGPLELAEHLSQSVAVQNCVARQWLRFALARNQFDAATLTSVESAFEASGGNIRELLFEIATAASFVERTVQEGENAQ